MRTRGNSVLNAELEGFKELKESLGRIKESFITQDSLAGISGEAMDLILKRTAEGVDSNKEVFTHYSHAYKRVREKSGKSADTVDLRSSGRMLDDLAFEVRTDTNESTLYFKETDSQKKACLHQVSGVGKDITRREFFSLSEEETTGLIEFYSIYIEKVLKENL